jgi:hypothetical protein
MGSGSALCTHRHVQRKMDEPALLTLEFLAMVLYCPVDLGRSRPALGPSSLAPIADSSETCRDASDETGQDSNRAAPAVAGLNRVDVERAQDANWPPAKPGISRDGGLLLRMRRCIKKATVGRHSNAAYRGPGSSTGCEVRDAHREHRRRYSRRFRLVERFYEFFLRASHVPVRICAPHARAHSADSSILLL